MHNRIQLFCSEGKMTGCVTVDTLINAQQQRFIKAAVFVMELHQLIFLDAWRSCERPETISAVLLALEGVQAERDYF